MVFNEKLKLRIFLCCHPDTDPSVEGAGVIVRKIPSSFHRRVGIRMTRDVFRRVPK